MALGIALLIRPLSAPASMLRQELPLLLGVTLITGVLFANLHLGILDSLLLIGVLVLLTLHLIHRRTRATESVDASEAIAIEPMSTLRASVLLAVGLGLLLVSADALVGGASAIATHLGVSSAIIGLTIVALGTSLPELAACVASVMRGQSDLALGNIVGSNILNLLIVLPFPGLLAAGLVETPLVTRDYFAMLLMTLVLALSLFWTIKSGKKIGRIYGMLFLAMYAAWFITLYQQA